MHTELRDTPTTNPAFRLLTALAAALLLLPLLTVPADAATGDPSSGSDPVVAQDRNNWELVAEAYAMKAHNTQRQASDPTVRNGDRHTDVDSGKKMVGYTDILTVARRWSDQIGPDEFYHNPDYSDQYGHWASAGENIAYRTIKPARNGTPTNAEVEKATENLMQAWWNSTGHRQNWMKDSWDHFAVGASVRKAKFMGDDYWILTLTTNFRRHDGTTVDGDAFAADGSLPPNETDSNNTDSNNTDSSDKPPAGATPIAGDWDGNGTDNIGWYHNGAVALHTPNKTIRYQYGRTGDIPIVGDFNGNGTDTVSIVRDRQWHINNHHKGGAAQKTFVYGRTTRGDIPLIGDWNGDGRDTVGIVRNGEWHLRNDLSGGPGQIVFIYGRVLKGDVPVIGNWNGRNGDTIGIVRGTEWHLRHELAGGPADRMFHYGDASADDLPVVGDWDGNGTTTAGIVRDSTWHLSNSLRGGSADRTINFAG